MACAASDGAVWSAVLAETGSSVLFCSFMTCGRGPISPAAYTRRRAASSDAFSDLAARPGPPPGETGLSPRHRQGSAEHMIEKRSRFVKRIMTWPQNGTDLHVEVGVVLGQ